MTVVRKRKAKVYVFLPSRNEEKTIRNCLDNLLSQTLKPKRIFVVNDGSIDKTEFILNHYCFMTRGKVDFVSLPYHRESYVNNPFLAYNMASVLNYAFPVPEDYDFIMQHAPDILLKKDYIQRLTGIMEKDPRLVVASGVIEGEPKLETNPSGVGRIYKTWFWNRYIKKFPNLFAYESFPLYKAVSRGLKVRLFPSLKMKTLRPSTGRPDYYGFAMRELGYFPPFALFKCLLGIRRYGVRLFVSYFRSPFGRMGDRDITSWAKRSQVNVREKLRKWKS